MGSPAADDNPYLAAKAEVERMVATSGLEHAILRCTHVLGPGGRLVELLGAGPAVVRVLSAGGFSWAVALVWVVAAISVLVTGLRERDRAVWRVGAGRCGRAGGVGVAVGRRGRTVRQGPGWCDRVDPGPCAGWGRRSRRRPRSAAAPTGPRGSRYGGRHPP